MTLYLDASALVKLVQREAESAALRRHLRRRAAVPLVTSALSRTEVVRAVLPGGVAAVERARQQLGRIHQIAVDDSVLDSAATLRGPGLLRSLDAVHLASAKLLGGALEAVVTYDQRMAAAAEAMGLRTTAPS